MTSLTERAKIGLKALSKKPGYTYEEMMENKKWSRNERNRKTKKVKKFNIKK
jgi:hypothetical protein